MQALIDCGLLDDSPRADLAANAPAVTWVRARTGPLRVHEPCRSANVARLSGTRDIAGCSGTCSRASWARPTSLRTLRPPAAAQCWALPTRANKGGRGCLGLRTGRAWQGAARGGDAARSSRRRRPPAHPHGHGLAGPVLGQRGPGPRHRPGRPGQDAGGAHDVPEGRAGHGDAPAQV